MGTHFTEDEMLKLVQIYKEFDCLWDPTHEFYKDRSVRQNAYTQILKQLDIPTLTVTDIPNKIKNLRSSYYQEIKRIRESVKLGARGDSVYKPKVCWFPIADGFLSAFRNEREPISKTLKAIKFAKKTVSSQIHEEIGKIGVDKIAERITPSHVKEDDEFDSFGKYIATALRSMPQEFSIMGKTELQKTISEIQLQIVRHHNAGGSIQSPFCSASTTSDYEYHSECVTPNADSCFPTVKVEFDN